MHPEAVCMLLWEGAQQAVQEKTTRNVKRWGHDHPSKRMVNTLEGAVTVRGGSSGYVMAGPPEKRQSMSGWEREWALPAVVRWGRTQWGQLQSVGQLGSKHCHRTVVLQEVFMAQEPKRIYYLETNWTHLCLDSAQRTNTLQIWATLVSQLIASCIQHYSHICIQFVQRFLFSVCSLKCSSTVSLWSGWGYLLVSLASQSFCRSLVFWGHFSIN